MNPTPGHNPISPHRPARHLLAVVLAATAIFWGGYQSASNWPPVRGEPRRLHWLERYTPLREPLHGKPDVIYLNAPEVKGKFRFFRAQYVLTPTTLLLRQTPAQLFEQGWPARPVVIDYQRERELHPMLAQLHRRAATVGIDLQVERFGRGLALVEAKRK